MDRSLLEKKPLAELRQIASTLELSGYQRMKKADLVDMIVGAGDGGAADTTSGNGSSGDTSTEGSSTAVHDDGGEEGQARQRARGRQRDDDDADREHDGGDASSSDDDDEDDEQGGRNRNKQRRRKNRGGGNQPDLEDAEVREGVLDLLPEGYGFLRTTGYLSGSKDVYVSQSFVRRFGLRRGDRVRGPIRSNNRGNDKFPALARVDTIEGLTVDEHMNDRRADFRDLTPVSPDEQLRLETADGAPLAMRIIDLLAPIGKGQRGLVVSPPKAGKTTILQQLARSIEANQPDVHVMVLLVDERPEEVTDFERAVVGEVISSTFDRPAEDHTQIAELCLERAKRLVERGRDVVVLMDSVTRLTRAYNLASPGSGRTLAGGLDSGALYPPKRFFGAARNVEDGGSLAIIGTVLVGTGSRMDEVVFEEFAGTANMELRLDRELEQQRLFPAIDVQQSASRHEELLLEDGRLDTVRKLRRALAPLDTTAALELLTERLGGTASNEEFLRAFEKDGLDAS